MTGEPLEYHRLLRAGREPAWAWSLLGVLVVVGAAFLVAPALWLVAFGLGYAVAGRPVPESVQALLDVGDPTPASLAYLNLTLATAIPITFLLVRVLHGLRPGWLTSVRPRLRWGYFAACLGLSVVALVATVLVATVLPGTGGTGAELSGSLNEFTRRTRDFLLVVLLLTPLQAAGEEYLFRGYLTQAAGSLADGWAGRATVRAVAVLVPSLLFAVAHGLGQGWPIFVDRLAFGLVAGMLVIVTGGLEAGIAMHVLNNFVAFGVALAFGDMATSLNPTGGSWWMLPSTLTQSLVYLGLAWWVARAMGVTRVADPDVLARSRGLVYRQPSAQPE